MKTVMRAVMLILMMGVVGITEGQESKENIEFADAYVKDLCLDNWDTNGDGELSYDEAAAVTDLGEVFKDNTDITSFNELQYFTGLTAIGSHAFEYCTSLSSITIPNTVKSIGEYAFYECTSLTSLTIGNSVTSMGSCAFAKCTGLKSVEIPNSVKSIGLCAFDGCTGLESVEIPNSVTDTSIGNSAFSGCTGLKSLTIGNSVKSIGGFAFAGCAGLKSLTIPNSVTSIGDGAFVGCTGLTEITSFAKSAPQIENTTFWGLNINSITLTVPYGSITNYQNAPGWNEFTNYQPMAYTEITGYGSSNDSDHWVFIASPLTSSVKPKEVDGLVADPYDLYRFNQSGNINDGEWENYKNEVHTEGFVLENGKGYLYANKNNVTLKFIGDMNTTSPQIVGLDYDDRANLPGWNLIGNPFTEDAYIDRPYYMMNPTGTDVLPVATYKETPVAAYSGIMVHAEKSGESVTFTKSGSKSSDNGGLQITLSKAGVRGDEAQDKVIVSFNKYAQLSKFIFNEDNAKLYIPMGGEDYAIAYSDRQSNMPLYFKTKEMGIYTMSFEGAIDNIKIIDNLGGSVIDLNAERSLTFVGTPSDRNDRFTIVFNTPATEDFAYQSGDGIVVNGEGELQVFDIMGRMVAKYHVNGVETVNIPCQSGVYVLRLLGKETNTQKIVVK